MAPPTLTNWLLGLVSALLALLITIAGWQFRAMDSRLEGIALSTTVMSVDIAVLKERAATMALRLDDLDRPVVRRP